MQNSWEMRGAKKKTSKVFHKFWLRTFGFYWIKFATVCIFQTHVCDLLKKYLLKESY